LRVLALASVVAAACSDGATPSGGSTGEDPAGGPGASCNQASKLIALSNVLSDAKHPCRDWVDRTYGRTFTTSFGATASILSVHTQHGSGILLTSFHQFGKGFFGAVESDVPLMLRDPGKVAPLPIVRPIDQQGFTVDTSYGGVPFFHPAVPSTEAGNLQNILPVHDFVLSAADGDTTPPTSRNALGSGKPTLYDPAHTLDLVPSYADPHPGDVVVAYGLPEILTSTGVTMSINRVLSDAEATDAVSALARLNDEEGSVPYDPKVEFLARGASTVGMSGAGAFTSEGRCAGVLVRASTQTISDRQIVRFVRATYIMQQLAAALASADAATRAAVAPYTEQP
jgi:hypothetical protein